MNKSNLHSIFKSYIDNFEVINTKHDESYKWEIAEKFQAFDVEAEDFVGVLTKMWKASENIIDSSHQLPFYALVDYATNYGEAETVRDMFRHLFADEVLDATEKQKRIDAFLDMSEELRQKHKPDSHLYIANQGTVMQLLFLRYPNSNYGYKASQAKSFADCIEFYEDWGPMTAFHLNVYNRMCDQVIEEIKQCEALLDTHKSRYEHTDRHFHADENLHILLLDIIYSSQTYNFYEGISFSPITAQARKLHFEKIAKAKELENALMEAQADATLLAEGLEYLSTTLKEGMSVWHKAFGEGVIKGVAGTVIEVEFPQKGETKKLGITVVVPNKFITFADPTVAEAIMKYIPVLQKENDIPNKVKRATEALEPYLDYLEE